LGTQGSGLFAQLHVCDLEEVDVRGEGPEQVQDVVPAVVADDAWKKNGRLDSVHKKY
jgi:hypothetical protein